MILYQYEEEIIILCVQFKFILFYFIKIFNFIFEINDFMVINN